jgi:hypothetical protein
MVKDTTAVAPSTLTPSDQSHDPSKLLLEILRNVNKEVRTNLELGDEAKLAVERFRLISADLAVTPVAVVYPPQHGAQQSRSKS